MDIAALLKQYAAGERNFEGCDVSEGNLVGQNLAQINLQRANLNVVNLTGATLTEANLTQAKLNVARLSGANLTQANLAGANLNVANLVRAIAQGADCRYASFVQAELVRIDLCGSNLMGCTITDADLREAKLLKVNLSDANLSNSDLRGSILAESYLSRANLHSANLSRADLRGADLGRAELRHTNLVRADLSGANLRGANLRWADLSGANLRWADLGGAKLSGATLVGATLDDANLDKASLVHSDLTQASLINADWTGADLTGVTLTGAKLYGVPLFKLVVDGMICDWIDLSPTGDQTLIRRFADRAALELFFSQLPPTVKIEIDGALTPSANLALATAYHNLAKLSPVLAHPPSITITHHRSTLSFRTEADECLLALAYAAIAPFGDAVQAWPQIVNFVKVLQRQEPHGQDVAARRLHTLLDTFSQSYQLLQEAKFLDLSQSPTTAEWLARPTQLVMTTAQNLTITLHQNPQFGKRFIQRSTSEHALVEAIPTAIMPETQVFDDHAIMDFWLSLSEV